MIEIVNKALKGMCEKFRFGYFDTEDMYQEGWIFALETGLEKYDGSRPLENFLRVSLRNFFINLKRNKFSRYDPPCLSCPFYDPDNKKSQNQCAEFVNKDDCDKWKSWRKRNKDKEGLMRPIDISSIHEDDNPFDKEMIDSVNFGEIRKIIDRKLDMDLRADFLRMLEGMYVPKDRKIKIREAIREMGVLDEFEER